MPDKSISNLPVITTVAGEDLALVLDVSAEAGSKTSQITLQDLANGMHPLVDPDLLLDVSTLPVGHAPASEDLVIFWNDNAPEGDQLNQTTLSAMALVFAELHDALKPPQYGSVFISEGVTPATVPASTWTIVDGGEVALLSEVTYTNGAFIVPEDGVYAVDFSISSTGAGNVLIRVNCFINGILRPEMEYYRNRQNATDIGNNHVGGLFELSAGDTVDMRVFADTEFTITVKAMHFQIRRTGR